mgnify:CR=1 FL=1
MLTYDMSKREKTPAYQYLYHCIKDDILSGSLLPNEKLPSKRSLSTHLGVSVVTVMSAYELLVSEGYLYTKPKSGYFVVPIKTQQKVTNFQLSELDFKEFTPWFDFSGNATDSSDFPFSVWSKLMRKTLLDYESELLNPIPYNGAEILRKALCQYLFHHSGMKVYPEQIIIGAGAEYLYSVIIRLVGSNKTYALENPGYNRISQIYQMNQVATEYIDVERKYSEWLNERGSDRKDTMKTETTVSFHDIKKYYEVVYKRIFDDKNNFVCDYFIFNDKTEDIQSLEKEKYKATHDRLTGLYNKDQFYVETYKILHRNADVPYCMLCSNIRDFKFVNELFGIEKGNEVLVKQAEIMKEYASDDIIAARINSDRFAMLIPKKSFSVDMILSIIHRMQDYFKDSSFHLHIFTGVYDISDLEEPVSIMCDKANLASETIKNEYKSNIAYYTERLFESSIEERRIIGEFERAISNNEFEMYLQPQVDSSGNLYGAEALVRWQHPERGLLSPAIFIDVLEKTGFIYKLDRYMWDKAAKKLGEWKKEGKDQYHISVNISTKDFYLVDVYETFVGLVDKYDIDPVNLNIEITETTLMSDFDKNMGIIRLLQNYGFNIEIDDFGSGYSSLNMLKDISADVLKIDMGFLRASENEAKGLDILESIITLAGKLGMKVITEGVETKKQLYMLVEMGCDMYQGYYFSKPIPVDEFEKKYNIK